MNSNKSILFGVFFSISGFIYVLLITNINNLGASPDSVSYIICSRNIFDGKGFDIYKNTLRFSSWPPLYSITLSLTSKILSIDSIEASRYLSAFLLFATIFMINLFFVKFNLNNLNILILNLLVFTSNPFKVYQMIWSEPLFIFLLLLLCYVFFQWIYSNSRLTLFLCGLLSGLLILTRYAGIGFVFGIALFMLFYKSEPIKKKLTNIIPYLGSTFLIVFPWFSFLNEYTPEAGKNRPIGFHLISAGHMEQLMYTIINWFSPSFFKFGFFLFILFFGLIIFDIKKNKAKIKIPDLSEYTKFLIFLIFSYLFFLFCTISFIDYHVYLENRIMAPLFVIVILLTIPVFKKIESIKRNSFLYYLPVMFILFSCSYAFIINNKDFYENGIGYTTKTWQNSELINYLENNYTGQNIYTNGADALLLLYEKENELYRLPMVYSPASNQENVNLKKEIEVIKNSLETGDSKLVYFDKLSWREYYIGKDLIKKELQNFNIDSLNDGFVLYKKNPDEGK